MIKKTMYPKTPRISVEGDKICITEKIDGSNLCIFKKNDEIYFAQRNNILKFEELTKDNAYKGLIQFATENIEVLKNELHEGAVLCGEWIGMGCLKYPVDEFNSRFLMFAKANVNDDFELERMNYEHDKFIYPFISQSIPSFIGIVPIIKELTIIPNKEYLDSIYQKYCESVGRNVEGFVVSYKNIISKYVRMKNGKLREHFEHEKEENK